MAGRDDEDATVFGGEGGPEAVDPDRTVFANEVPAPRPATPAADRSRPAAPAQERRADSSDPTFEGADRTHHALAVMELSGVFRHRFHAAHFGLSPRYRVSLNAPDVPTTDGGAQARLPILLSPEGHGASRGVVVGWILEAERQAHLRAFEALGTYFERRFGRPVDIVESEYARLLDELRRFAEAQRLSVRMVEKEKLPAPTRPEKRPPAPITLRTVILAVLTILCIGVLIGVLIARR